MKRVVVAVVVVAVAAGLVVPSAVAATKAAHGWWWRAQTGLLGTAIPPPGVPEDGLAVEAIPDGPTALSALRYVLDKGESQPVLELKVADQQGELTIQACPATQHWSSDHGGPWDERPTYDCGAAAKGEPSEDGATWRWELSTLVRRQRLDVVLVPASGSGRVTFEPPDDGSLQTRTASSGAGGGGQSFDPPPVSDFTDPDPAPGDKSAGGSSPPADSGSPGTQAQPFAPTSGGEQAPAAAQPPAMAAPRDGAAPEPAVAAAPQAPLGAGLPSEGAAPPAQTIPASSETSRMIGALIAAMAIVLALGLWHQDSAIPRRMGALAKAGIGVGPQSYGGLGRFARARTGSPRPLL